MAPERRSGVATAAVALDAHIVVQRGEFTLDVSLQVPPGITILFGPSGSGKSTTLAAIAGLVAPDRGRVAVGDEVWFDSTGRTDLPVHQRGLAFVFQSLALFPHMSALANVEYGIDRALGARDRRRRAAAMLERMRVGHLSSRRPATFSGGEAQRVALARAFAREPRLVLLDEPFSAMDRELRRELCNDVRATVRELGVPMLMVTHHRQEARLMGERAVVLESGRVRASGAAASVLGDVGPDAHEDMSPARSVHAVGSDPEAAQ